MLRSANPALRGALFERTSGYPQGNAMTIDGTINKSVFLLVLTVFSAVWVWSYPTIGLRLILPAGLGGFAAGLITVFKKEKAAITSPIYALLQGVFLGGISAHFESLYPGVAIQAVGLTFGTFLCMLLAYKSGLIKVTDKFRLGIFAATGGIALIYFISFILRIFGMGIGFVYGAGPAGILFSLFVVGIASLNLVLDFDFIEKGAELGAPGYMEWYASFGLLVTLIWLYIEMLRLLAKLNSRR